MQTLMTPAYKDKIPSFLSYPLKSSEICLNIAIHAKSHPFQFCYFNYHAPKEAHDDSLSYLVCELRYGFGYLQEKEGKHWAWDLSVRPVLRRHRKIISDFFVNEGFQKLEICLGKPKTPLWYATHHWLKLEYCPKGQSFLFTDSE